MAAVAVFAVVQFAVDEFRAGQDPGSVSPASQAFDPSDYPEDWDLAVAPYVAFVAAERGLRFSHPVEVEFLDIEAALNESALSDEDDFDEETLAYFEDWGQVNYILGLTEAGKNPWTAQTQTQAEGAAAYYDPEREVIVLPIGGAGIDLQLSIVHELTHVLQHQNGLLDGEAYTEDQAGMNLALIEGEASFVENSWRSQLSLADMLQLEAETAALDYTVPSGYFAASLAAPYLLGEPVVSILLDRGGQEGLEQAQFENYLTTEMLIDPLTASPEPLEANKRYADDTMPDSGEYGTSGALGPLMLYQVLAPELGAVGAVEAIRGYDTDTFQLWHDEGRSCMDLRIWFDEESEAEEFDRLASPVLGVGTLGSTGVPKAPSVDYVLCDENPVGSPGDQSLDLLMPLVWNNYIAAALLLEGSPAEAAGCGSRGVALNLDQWEAENSDFETLLDEARLLASSPQCQSGK